MRRQFPWYDSAWLTRFVKGCEFVSTYHEDRCEEFVAAFRPLRTDSRFREQHFTDPFTPEEIRTIRNATSSLKLDLLEMHEVATHGRFVVHDHPMIKSLHAEIAPRISQLVGEEVRPTYNFMALYKRNAKCGLHLDAPVAKWTLDFCVDQDDPWPIHFSEVIQWPDKFDAYDSDWERAVKSSPHYAFRSYDMRQGDAILFSGSSQWHYREAFQDPVVATRHSTLLFLHFAPLGTDTLVEPGLWERAFALPGLTKAIESN